MALCGELRVKCQKKCIVVFHDDGSSECGMLSVKSFFGLIKHARNTHMAPFVADDDKTNSTDAHKNNPMQEPTRRCNGMLMVALFVARAASISVNPCPTLEPS